MLQNLGNVNNVPKIWQQRLYFGTWQLGGQFRSLTTAEIESLLAFALDQGIRKFDTAMVYGRGQVEAILGRVLPKDAAIVTKVPAKAKPALETQEPIEVYYDRDWIMRQVEGSLNRLNRDKIEILLIHNWVRQWGRNSMEPLAVLDSLRCQKLVGRIGISLPDGFAYPLDRDIVALIDVIETPFNLIDNWIRPELPIFRELGKEVILRSLFLQGLLLMDEARRQVLAPADKRHRDLSRVRHLEPQSASVILQKVWPMQTSIVIGMTSKSQIIENLRYLQSEE